MTNNKLSNMFKAANSVAIAATSERLIQRKEQDRERVVYETLRTFLSKALQPLPRGSIETLIMLSNVSGEGRDGWEEGGRYGAWRWVPELRNGGRRR